MNIKNFIMKYKWQIACILLAVYSAYKTFQPEKVKVVTEVKTITTEKLVKLSSQEIQTAVQKAIKEELTKNIDKNVKTTEKTTITEKPTGEKITEIVKTTEDTSKIKVDNKTSITSNETSNTKTTTSETGEKTTITSSLTTVGNDYKTLSLVADFDVNNKIPGVGMGFNISNELTAIGIVTYDFSNSREKQFGVEIGAIYVFKPFNILVDYDLFNKIPKVGLGLSIIKDIFFGANLKYNFENKESSYGPYISFKF